MKSFARLLGRSANEGAVQQRVGTDKAGWCARFAGSRWSPALPLNPVLNGPEMVEPMEPDPSHRLLCVHCGHAAPISPQLLQKLSGRLSVPSSLVINALIERRRGLKCSSCNGRQFMIELSSANHLPEGPEAPRVCSKCGKQLSDALLAQFPKAIVCEPCRTPATLAKTCRSCGRTIAGSVRPTRRGCSGCSRYDG